MRDAALARPHEGCAVASLAWSSGGALYVTVVVKATVSLRHGAPAVLVSPTPVALLDRWEGPDPQKTSLDEASELFPYRPRVDVTFTGHAHLGATGIGVARLAVVGNGGWIDKTLEVRPPPARSRTRAPVSRVPLEWEGTWSDADNPVGVAPGGSLRAWITDPTRPGAAAGLGPLAPWWPRRSAALGSHDVRFLDEDAPRFPDSFDWQHFHAAPLDQQIGWLEGDESIELQGLVPGYPVVQTRLPGLAAAAWAFAPWEVAEGQPLDLIADGLVIDGDRGVAHVVWRGTYPVLHEEWSLSQLQFLASVTASIGAHDEGSWAGADPVSEVTPAPVEVVRTPPPPAPRTLAGLGPAAIPAASLFETDDGEDEGTRPLTRKELLAAMAAAGKALPFGPPRRRERTSEIEIEAPASIVTPPTSGAGAPRAEATRPLPLQDVLTADGDHLTVTGDEEVLSQAASGAMPTWLRVDAPPVSSPAPISSPVPNEDTPDASIADEASMADEETQVNDAVLRRR